MNYFKDCQDVNEIKKEYRRLAKKHHPDLGGDVRIMQEVNAQYHAALAGQHKTEYTGSDEKPHTYYYNEETETEITEKLRQVLAAPLPGCEVWIAGLYIWIRGDTRPHKDTIKDFGGFWWNRRRSAWSWKPAGVRRSRYNSNAQSLDDVLSYYNGKQAKASQRRQNSPHALS